MITTFNTLFLCNEYTKLGVYFLISCVLASLILFLSWRLTTKNPDAAKLSTYECGFEPYEDARDIFDVRFYLVAVLFLIFDLEAAYFFPWLISLNSLNFNGFSFMVDFVIELIVGYIYAWYAGALNWN
jgi:NADH-quinone oxidoreductase subunit A